MNKVIYFLSIVSAATCYAQGSRVSELAQPTLISNAIETPQGIRKVMPNAQTKTNIPAGCQLVAHHAGISTAKRFLDINHPSGGELLGGGGPAGALDSLLAALKNEPLSLAYLRKVQFFALHDLFVHLVSVRTAFNMIHPRSTSNDPHELSKNYLELERNYAFNKKAAIIDHLLNIVQTQLFYSIINFFPNLPSNIATLSGKVLMEHDYGTNLNFLIQEQELAFFGEPESGDVPAASAKRDAQTMLKATQGRYLAVLKQFLNLMGSFTSVVDQPTRTPQSPNQLHAVAKNIALRMQAHFSAIQRMQKTTGAANAQSAAQQASALARDYIPMNPTLFMYNKDTLRALAAIPVLAKSLPANIQPLGWPEQLVKAAKTGERARTRLGETMGYPIAYFRNVRNDITYNEHEAVGLYILIPMAQDLYEQRVLKQPEWLNSERGILRMLKACLGSYGDMLGFNIFNPCLEAIFVRAQQMNGGGLMLVDMSGVAEWRKCQDWLKVIQQAQEQFVKDLQKKPREEERSIFEQPSVEIPEVPV